MNQKKKKKKKRFQWHTAFSRAPSKFRPMKFLVPSLPREKFHKFHHAIITICYRDVKCEKSWNWIYLILRFYELYEISAFDENKIAKRYVQGWNNNIAVGKKEKKRKEGEVTRNSVNTRMYEASYDMNAPRQSEIAASRVVCG